MERSYVMIKLEFIHLEKEILNRSNKSRNFEK